MKLLYLNKKSGKPYISLIGKTKKHLKKNLNKKKSKISLSLSDEKNMLLHLLLFQYEKKNSINNL